MMQTKRRLGPRLRDKGERASAYKLCTCGFACTKQSKMCWSCFKAMVRKADKLCKTCDKVLSHANRTGLCVSCAQRIGTRNRWARGDFDFQRTGKYSKGGKYTHKSRAKAKAKAKDAGEG